jgi:hypothetical protein
MVRRVRLSRPSQICWTPTTRAHDEPDGRRLDADVSPLLSRHPVAADSPDPCAR